uniref:S-phase kinase-associated protein 2 n=1 Tax=Poecilia reticulata TaxID=8081 RepID=A0A3P9NGW8_POERE
MSEDSLPLQQLSSQKRFGTKRKSLGSESTPTDLVLLRSPRPKQPWPACLGKENQEARFVLARRSRRRRRSGSGVSWDQLPDELLLRICGCLPLPDLLRASAVCRRWRRLALDESLWVSVDLEGLTQTGPALRLVLRTGVQRLRCPRAFVEEPDLSEPGLVTFDPRLSTMLTCEEPEHLDRRVRRLQLVDLDLSGSVVSPSALRSVVCRCSRLRRLSLEALPLSDDVLSCLAQNPDLLQLNLGGCSGFSAAALAAMLDSCRRLEQLNISWCSFSRNHVQNLVETLSPSVTQLNLSGYRDRLALDDVKVLVDRCPDLQTLDLSDSTLLTADSFLVLKRLQKLLHLSLSRCYHIHLAALSDLGKAIPSLRFLDVFGLVQDGQLAALQDDSPRLAINARPFSAVARPTPAGAAQPDRTMWGRGCRLKVRF